MKNITPNYIYWTYPNPPRVWVWIVLFALSMVTDVGATLLYYASSPAIAVSERVFWLLLLVPGFCIWLFSFGLRLGWYALWQIHAAVNEQRNAADQNLRKKMSQERAWITKIALIGPACASYHDLPLLMQGKMPIPIPKQFVLRIAMPADRQWHNIAAVENIDSASSEPSKEDKTLLLDPARRARLLCQLLADQIMTWIKPGENGAVSDVFAWVGTLETWQLFVAEMKKRQCYLHDQPTYLNQGTTTLDDVIDHLYVNIKSVNQVLCLGIGYAETHPTQAPDEGDNPKGEAVFALQLNAQANGGLSIARPVEIINKEDVIKAHLNAKLETAPEGGFVQLISTLPSEAGEAGWMSVNTAELLPYWGNTGHLALWIALLHAAALAKANAKPTGWFAQAQQIKLSGVVISHTQETQGETA